MIETNIKFMPVIFFNFKLEGLMMPASRQLQRKKIES